MIDERRFEAIKRITSMVYKNACREVGYSIRDIQLDVIYGRIDRKTAAEKKDVVDSKYCELICKLSTRVLDTILEIHENGQLRRAQRTLDAIANELLERTLNETEPKGTSKEEQG